MLALLGVHAARAGAEGSIEVLSIDHATRTITVDQELSCTPLEACIGAIYWGDGQETWVLPEDNGWDATHTYAASSCYHLRLYVYNYQTREEAWYSAGAWAVGAGATCEPEAFKLYLPLVPDT